MRRLLASTLALAGVAAFAIPALAATRPVKVGDNYYVRDGRAPTVTIKRGDTVVWRFVGRSPHTVTARNGRERISFSSRAMTSGTYRRTLRKAARYTVYCRIHGAKDQSMRLIVK